jgi:hypothetical protein
MMEEDDGSIYEDTGKKMLLFGRFNKETKGFMLNTDHQFFNGCKDHCTEFGGGKFHKEAYKLRKKKEICHGIKERRRL